MHQVHLAGLLLIPLLCASCGPHTVRGRVVRGEASFITVVDKDDHRLKEQGIGGVLLKAELDPGRLEHKTVAQEMTDESGDFGLPIDEFGAGLLEFDLAVLARKRGFSPAEGVFKLPSGSRRLLIFLAPGRDVEPSTWDEEPVEKTLERYR